MKHSLKEGKEGMKLEFLADHPQFIPVVADWYYNEWGCKVADNSYEKTCERIAGKLNRDKVPLHVVAVEEDRLLGVGQLKKREMDIYPDKEFWIGSIYVSREERGRGVASQIVERLVEIAKSFSIETLHLQTENLTDGGLYSKLGWKPIEHVRYHDVDVLVMERVL